MIFRKYITLAALPLMLVVVQVIALLLASPMQGAGYAAFEDPASVGNIFVFVIILLGFTLFLLVLMKFGAKRLISGIIAVSIFLTFVYIFSALVIALPIVPDAGAILAFICAGAATALLYLYPEWYVIDILGVLIAAGVSSLFGISLTIIPAIILLILLALYDAVSVYRTKHMITLAEGVIDLKLPIMVVVPKRRGYSFIRDGFSIKEGEERSAFIMGLGDLIIPTILVVSAQTCLGPVPWFPVSIPVLGAMAGSVAGLAVVLHFANKGKAQAGLPPLNGGAIAGFLIGCALTGAWDWVLCI